MPKAFGYSESLNYIKNRLKNNETTQIIVGKEKMLGYIVPPKDYEKLQLEFNKQNKKRRLIVDMDLFLQLASGEIWKRYCTVKNKEKGLVTGRPFVIWSCKTLQNMKAILGIPGKNKWLFEVTLDGDMNAMYLDCYSKMKNVPIALEQLEKSED
ncbi:DUF6275 family protein [Fructilactobacillus hinvesii]|uniref:DUF6275 family protein n=1 Tax=Fructilactobacillus hinvesii TaxID=2940300 RepID=A0ABY5BSP0_9LACO|nr:DUF6275 family protein [Fructilactobacillus hinvesii]USS87483.1 DUF6275 family protein [Fructilactobacillus hinvesii]